MDEKRITRLVGLSLGGVFAIGLIPECNQPLGWNDTGRLRTRHTDFAYCWPPRGVPMRRALSASAIWSGLGTSTPVRRVPSNQVKRWLCA